MGTVRQDCATLKVARRTIALQRSCHLIKLELHVDAMLENRLTELPFLDSWLQLVSVAERVCFPASTPKSNFPDSSY